LKSLVNPLTSFFDMIHNAILGLGISNLSLAFFLDIFIFTLILKTIVLPLTIMQTKSTVRMGELQPKLKELQEKHKNDPQKLQQKQMELYKEMGVNPLGGCLPILAQFPVFMAMYYVIYNYTGFAGVPFLWVKDLAAADKTFILPVLSGLTTFIAGVLMYPKGNDQAAKMQKQMNIFMSIFFVYISYKFKAALVLYWVISNIIQLAQQKLIINRIKNKLMEDQAKPATK
jgi:YidC/Oxa1 family membrane protein insertase